MASEMLRDLFAKRDKAYADLQYVAEVYRSAPETEGYEAAYTSHRDALVTLDARILEVEGQENRDAEIAKARERSGLDKIPVGDGVVRSEPKTYGGDSESSYYQDLCFSALPGSVGHDDAVRRLQRHGTESVRDAQNDPKERRRLITLFQEAYREQPNNGRAAVAALQARSGELRTGMDTGSTSGGSFVTPQYLVSDWAPYRQFGRTFVDKANILPLPDYGMTIYLPHVTQAASVIAQAGQNTAIAEQDPNAAYLSTGLTTVAGQVTVAQQLLDRAGPGVQFDQIIFDQLQRSYNYNFDNASINTALSTALSVSDTSTTASATAIIGDFYSDVANASQKINTAAGVVLSPTDIFMTPTQWSFLSAQIDTNGRPLVVPNYAGAFNAIAAAVAGSKENVVPEGDTGFSVQSLPVWKDGAIPASGSNTQIIVAHMPEVWIWEGSLIPRTVPQTYAQNLQVLLQVYSYNAVLVRYPSAVCFITGNRYPAAPSFPNT